MGSIHKPDAAAAVSKLRDFGLRQNEDTKLPPVSLLPVSGKINETETVNQ
jgi:hypothetical protein